MTEKEHKEEKLLDVLNAQGVTKHDRILSAIAKIDRHLSELRQVMFSLSEDGGRVRRAECDTIRRDLEQIRAKLKAMEFEQFSRYD